MFSARNVVLVAIMQIGVLVAGVLAAGIWHKAAVSNHVPLPLATSILVNCGGFGFAIPFVWAVFTLVIRSRNYVSDDMKNAMFLIGVLMLILLVIFVIHAFMSPAIEIMWANDGE